MFYVCTAISVKNNHGYLLHTVNNIVSVLGAHDAGCYAFLLVMWSKRVTWMYLGEEIRVHVVLSPGVGACM